MLANGVPALSMKKRVLKTQKEHLQLENFHQKLRKLKVGLILILSQLFHLTHIILHLHLAERYEFRSV